MSPRRRVLAALAPGLGLALALTAFLDIAVLVVPIYDMQLYDRVLQSRNMDTLAMLSVACAAGLLLFGVLEYLRSACFLALAEAMGRHLDSAVLTEGVRRAASGDHTTGPQLVRDLNELQGFLSSGAVAAPLDALCAPLFLLVLFMLHPALGFFGVGGVALLVLAGIATERLVSPALLAAQARRTAAGHELARSLAEPEVADGLGMLPAIGRRWAARHGLALAGLDRIGARALALAGAARLLRMALAAGMMALGAVLVIAGATTPGSLMGANLLFGKLLMPFDHLVSSWRSWALAYASWRRIDELFADAAEAPAPSSASDARLGLLLRGVSLLTPDGRALLDGLDVHVPPGTLVAVTGPNGAGKTTLLRLLAGLMPPTRGMITMDGERLHGGAGYLPQSVGLMEGTVAENIARFGDDAVDPAVAAARLAGVHDTIGRLPRGYDTPLGRNGASLSGGMRQRVGLARALFGAPRLIVLDEPDASLDEEGTQALLRALLAARAGGAVVVVTSHRPALSRAADMTIELQRGGLVVPAPAARPPGQLATA